jgi:hypothetical protein
MVIVAFLYDDDRRVACGLTAIAPPTEERWPRVLDPQHVARLGESFSAAPDGGRGAGTLLLVALCAARLCRETRGIEGS